MTSFPRRAAMLLAASAFLLSGRAALAQEAEEAAGNPGELAARAYQLDDANDARRLQLEYYAASYFASRQSARPKPYSGQQVVEHRRRLADGNEISTRELSMVYRDSHGRTRKEVSSGTARKSVIIVDPVAQVAYLIRPGREDVLRVSGPARAPARLTAVEPGARPSPYKTWLNTSLGDKDMAGLMVTGMRMESTIPAGVDGNARDIHVIHETWRSRELGIFIQSRMVDPRSGERNTYYEHLTLDEPAAEVFAPPAGYAVHDVPSSPAGS